MVYTGQEPIHTLKEIAFNGNFTELFSAEHISFSSVFGSLLDRFAIS
jgi:hypothetical protein